MTGLILYSYWRSSSTWRVRIALAHKGLDASIMPVHLVRDGGEQHASAHVDRNPFHQIPTLGVVPNAASKEARHISQSLAIMEWLEDRYPGTPSIFPSDDPFERAKTRQLAEIINAGTQPLQNLSVIQHLRDELGVDARAFCRRYIERGLMAYQATLGQEHVGPYSLGRQLTMADFCLIPQLYNARRFKLDMEPFGALLEIEAACEELDAFKRAHPTAQPDFDPNAPA